MDNERVIRNLTEMGRRIGAARGYALLQRPAFAKALEVSVSTLNKMERGTDRKLPRIAPYRCVTPVASVPTRNFTTPVNTSG